MTMKHKRGVPRMRFTEQVCALLINDIQICITYYYYSPYLLKLKVKVKGVNLPQSHVFATELVFCSTSAVGRGKLIYIIR